MTHDARKRAFRIASRLCFVVCLLDAVAFIVTMVLEEIQHASAHGLKGNFLEVAVALIAFRSSILIIHGLAYLLALLCSTWISKGNQPSTTGPLVKLRNPTIKRLLYKVVQKGCVFIVIIVVVSYAATPFLMALTGSSHQTALPLVMLFVAMFAFFGLIRKDLAALVFSLLMTSESHVGSLLQLTTGPVKRWSRQMNLLFFASGYLSATATMVALHWALLHHSATPAMRLAISVLTACLIVPALLYAVDLAPIAVLPEDSLLAPNSAKFTQ